MSENIKRLMNEKQQIYNTMLNLLEQNMQRGGNLNGTMTWNANILGDIVVNNANNFVIVPNRLAQLSGLTMLQAMESSFSRILKK